MADTGNSKNQAKTLILKYKKPFIILKIAAFMLLDAQLTFAPPVASFKIQTKTSTNISKSIIKLNNPSIEVVTTSEIKKQE